MPSRAPLRRGLLPELRLSVADALEDGGVGAPAVHQPDDAMSARADHFLKHLWLMQKNCLVEADRFFQRVPEKATARVLQRNGLIAIENGCIRLLPKGVEAARSLIRRHLLAERLLHDVLQVSEGEVSRSACAFEHILSPEVTESVCTFLGHPPVCPHGLAIPRGKCCADANGQVKPLVCPLHELSVGETGRIAFIAPGREQTMERLAVFGVTPGRTVRLEQTTPTRVIRVDETLLALEEALSRRIYVKTLPQ